MPRVRSGAGVERVLHGALDRHTGRLLQRDYPARVRSRSADVARENPASRVVDDVRRGEHRELFAGMELEERR